MLHKGPPLWVTMALFLGAYLDRTAVLLTLHALSDAEGGREGAGPMPPF